MLATPAATPAAQRRPILETYHAHHPSPRRPAGPGALAACTATQANRTLANAQQVVTDGQLVCQVGPTAFEMLDPSGAKILAKDATKQAVTTVCGLVNGVAVALPSVSVQPAGLVVQLPPSVTIPLKA